jgi:ribosomal protein S12 methylthiotransferase accessory factor
VRTTARRSSGAPRPSLLPVVFVGPSLPHDRAREVLAADYRLPIRRGDLDTIAPGAVVAIIDGVFDQHLAVSPSEIRAALARGIRVFGASSMGALRAVEVPEVVGIGRVYEMYRDGIIDSDDEVAITFDLETLRPLCEPLVNVRYAVERLSTPGTISRELGAAIVTAARRLPYGERVYPRILQVAGLSSRADAPQLARMLASYDLKREDAVTLLEHLKGARPARPQPRAAPATRSLAVVDGAAPAPADAARVHFWEFGPPIPFRDLVQFLAMTGVLSAYGRRALARLGREDAVPPLDAAPGPSAQALRSRLLAQTARAWHWATEEEVSVSLRDLGLDQVSLDAHLTQDVETERRVMALTRDAFAPFLDALRAELFLDDLALKREAARASSLEWLASLSVRCARTLTAAERTAATEKLCEVLDVRDARTAFEYLGWWGIAPERVDAFIVQLAHARAAAAGALTPTTRRTSMRVAPSRKVRGSRRFCVGLSRAHAIVKRLQPLIGVTRVAMITGLGTVGIPNAQAFRPDGEWSSTVGSGKSESAIGARVGAVMEEVEKWAQEHFARTEGNTSETVASFATLRRRGRRAIDPTTLDLPYDSCYRPDLAIGWHTCADLADGGSLLVPTAALTHRRVPDDIYFSPQGGRKTVTTNGLASGFTVAEALTHALCEYIERHARALDFIAGENPGGPDRARRETIDLETLPRATRRLLAKVTRAGYRLRIREITSEVRVPTFCATVVLPTGAADGRLFGDGWQRASGWAAHPDPETAVTMAVLEAAQTIVSHVAGAREDLSLRARSLGRHERTEARRRAAAAGELAVDAPRRAFSTVAGFVSRDAAADVKWIVDRLCEGGCRHVLVADYSTRAIRPARVVRAIVPGLETINPFHTGPRARLALVRDLVPVSTENRGAAGTGFRRAGASRAPEDS